MKEERWKRIELIIEQALELHPYDRSAFIQQECGADRVLRKEIYSLLQSEEKAFAFIHDFEKNIVAPSISKVAKERFDESKRIDTVVGHYRITDILGSGGMGVIYKAEDIRLNRTVALKSLPAHMVHNEDKKKRLLREARAAASLNHPNIAIVYDVEETKGELFIVMEFIEGRSLHNVIYSSPESTMSEQKQEESTDQQLGSPTPINQALNIAFQITDGLIAAHQKGIVHRDLKSKNIMVNSQGRVKLLDFGLARLHNASSLTNHGTTIGTVLYMSPEQANGDEVDHRTDIWSLGVVLYEMLTGKRPFGGDLDQAVIYNILNKNPEPLYKSNSEVPDQLNKLVLKCLEKNVVDRYQTVEELINDLQRSWFDISQNKKYTLTKNKNVELSASDTRVISRQTTVKLLASFTKEEQQLSQNGLLATFKLIFLRCKHWSISAFQYVRKKNI